MKKLINTPVLDRPREKLVQKGIAALSSHELLMVILGRGMKGRDVAAQASDVLKLIETEKESITLEKLEQIQGIGVAKAGQILAAFELTKRYLIKDDKKIRNTEDILVLVADLRDKKQEHFITITLTGASTLIEKREVFKGTINFSVVHPREIFADALADRAAGIIFVHNHPADDAQPSEADVKLTKQLCDAAKLMGIQVVDHIIVTKHSYYSFQAENLLNQ